MRRSSLAVLAALATLAPHPAEAESLLSLPEPDLLERLGAPEARPRTRKGQVVYPAPGVPAIVQPGEEIVVRVRVRRALTPPPGVQQPYILAPWSARLVGWGARSVDGASAGLEYVTPVIQIRPEDEGFVYRVRLGTPQWVPPGVYDLEFEGPGIRDRRPRAVRVLPSSPTTLTLAVVEDGRALWDEAEALSWLDPTAVLVPGGARAAARPLARWPLATYVVPAPEELRACRRLELSDGVAAAVREASSCPAGRGETAATCILDALGGPEALDACGDGLADHLREHGSPAFAVGLGDVSLVGLDSFAHAPAQRAERRLALGGRLALVAPPLAAGARFGDDRLDWAAALGRWTRQVLLLIHHPPEEWPERARSRLERAFGSATVVVAAGRVGALDASADAWVHGPAELTLNRTRDDDDDESPRQLLGFEPGRFRLEAPRPRPRQGLVGARATSRDDGGLEVRLERPPTGRLSTRFTVPLRESSGGWSLEVEGGEGRIVGAWPATGDLCEPTRALLVVEVRSHGEGPLTIRLRPADDGRLEGSFTPASDPVVARTAGFRTDGFSENTNIFWDLGDGTSARGQGVSHRYIRSGPHRVCVVALDDRGRVAGAEWSLGVRRWSATMASDPARRRPLAWGLVVISLVALLLGGLKGNIVSTRHRSS